MTSVIDILTLAYDVTAATYAQHELVGSNKKACAKLVELVRRVDNMLRHLQADLSLLSDDQLPNVVHGLEAVNAGLLQAQDVVVTCSGAKNYFRDFISAGGVSQKLENAKQHLMTAMQLLLLANLSMAAEQRAIMRTLQATQWDMMALVVQMRMDGEAAPAVAPQASQAAAGQEAALRRELAQANKLLQEQDDMELARGVSASLNSDSSDGSTGTGSRLF